MSNQKYDQVPDLVGTGDLNWGLDHIQAHLVKGVEYVGTQKRVSEIMANTSAVKLQTADVQGRSVDESNRALGLPVTFPRVDENVIYQVLLAKDDGSGDDVLVAYYNVDENNDLLQVLNSGTMIVRPVLLPEGDPPTVGVWFVF
jgi:hypothetical protein